MEFEELQEIWDSQNNEPLYAINVQALHNRILSKKRSAGHISNFSELLVIMVYIGSGSLILGLNIYKQHPNLYMYMIAAWMFITAIYVLAGRIRRIKGNHRYDRSMLGDLKHAISNATHQVNLSQMMRWNILPVATLALLGIWDSGKSFWIIAPILIFFALTYYASGWEHNIYKSKKRELEVLQKKLVKEETAS